MRLPHQPPLLPSTGVRFASPRAPHLFCRVARTLSTLAMALMSNGGAPPWFGSIPFLSSSFTSFFVLPFPRRRAPRVWCDRRGCVRHVCVGCAFSCDGRSADVEKTHLRRMWGGMSWSNARGRQATHHHHHRKRKSNVHLQVAPSSFQRHGESKPSQGERCPSPSCTIFMGRTSRTMATR